MNSPETQVSSSAEKTASPPPSKVSGWVVVIVVMVVIGLLFGLLPRLRHRRALDKETLELAVPTVQVVYAAPGKASATLTLPAEVRAFTEAPIYSRASGYVKHWYVDIGAHVDAGQLLADIDTPELDQQLTGARADLAQAEAAMALAKITAERWAELLKTASVSEQENAEKQADMKLKAATVDAAKANVHRLQDIQSYTHVIAPFAGTLTVRDIDVGDLISSGKQLFRLADISKLRVFVRVPQVATTSIGPGVPAEMIVPELPARKFTAKVVRTAGAIDTSSRTLLTELEVENPRNEILSGSYAQVTFGDLRQDPSLVLSGNVLLFRAEGTQVGVVEPDGHVELRKVLIGRDFGKTLEILSGITATDRVIFNPSDSLVSGTLVRVATASEVKEK